MVEEFGVQQCEKSILSNEHPMNLILKLDLDIIKMSHHTKNEVSILRHLKVISHTDTQTDRQTDTHTDGMKTLPSRMRGR